MWTATADSILKKAEKMGKLTGHGPAYIGLGWNGPEHTQVRIRARFKVHFASADMSTTGWVLIVLIFLISLAFRSNFRRSTIRMV